MDALARCGDEGRGELRKASGSRTQAVSRRCPNGGTRQSSWAGIPGGIHRPGKRTWGTEPSQYLEEEKSTEMPGVAASERGRAKTVWTEQGVSDVQAGLWGMWGLGTPRPQAQHARQERAWNGRPEQVRALYWKRRLVCAHHPEYHGTRATLWEAGRPTFQG